MKIQLNLTVFLLALGFSFLLEASQFEKAPGTTETSEPQQIPDVVPDIESQQTPDVIGDDDVVKTNKPPKVPEPMGQREKALFQAAFDGNLAQVQAQLAKGADVNFADKDQRTALILAANNGHTAVVEFLFSEGGDLNVKDKSGMTPLMYTAKRSFNETARFLLNHGADVNVQSRKRGSTALMIASGWGNVELVQSLLEKGANPAITDKFGVTAEGLARKRGHTEIVSMLSDSATKH